MKTASANLTQHIEGVVQTIKTCWVVTREDGTIFRFTDHDNDIVITGQGALDGTYASPNGYSRTAIVTEAAFTVDNVDLDAPTATGGVERPDLRGGLFDNAQVQVFLVNYEAIADGVIRLRSGRLGEVKIEGSRYTAELRGLKQKLTTRIVEIYTPTCRADLGDERCKVDLNLSNPLTGTPMTEVGTVDEAIDRRRFLVSSALISFGSSIMTFANADFSAGTPSEGGDPTGWVLGGPASPTPTATIGLDKDVFTTRGNNTLESSVGDWALAFNGASVPAGSTYTAGQRITLAPTDGIDTGLAELIVRWLQAGWDGTLLRRGAVRVEFFDASSTGGYGTGTQLGSTLESSLIDAGDRWTVRSFTAAVPTGSRYADVTLLAKNDEGGANFLNVYFDWIGATVRANDGGWNLYQPPDLDFDTVTAPALPASLVDMTKHGNKAPDAPWQTSVSGTGASGDLNEAPNSQNYLSADASGAGGAWTARIAYRVDLVSDAGESGTSIDNNERCVLIRWFQANSAADKGGLEFDWHASGASPLSDQKREADAAWLRTDASAVTSEGNWFKQRQVIASVPATARILDIVFRAEKGEAGSFANANFDYVELEFCDRSGLAVVTPSDYYDQGVAIFTSGDNSGIRREIKSYDPISGQVTLFLPAPFDFQSGDGFTIHPGCKKRLTADCKQKFNNVVNFRGEPFVPGPDEQARVGNPEFGNSVPGGSGAEPGIVTLLRDLVE